MKKSDRLLNNVSLDHEYKSYDSKVNLNNLLQRRAKEKKAEYRNNIMMCVGATAVGAAVIVVLSL